MGCRCRPGKGRRDIRELRTAHPGSVCVGHSSARAALLSAKLADAIMRDNAIRLYGF